MTQRDDRPGALGGIGQWGHDGRRSRRERKEKEETERGEEGRRKKRNKQSASPLSRQRACRRRSEDEKRPSGPPRPPENKLQRCPSRALASPRLVAPSPASENLALRTVCRSCWQCHPLWPPPYRAHSLPNAAGIRSLFFLVRVLYRANCLASPFSRDDAQTALTHCRMAPYLRDISIMRVDTEKQGEARRREPAKAGFRAGTFSKLPTRTALKHAASRVHAEVSRPPSGLSSPYRQRAVRSLLPTTRMSPSTSKTNPNSQPCRQSTLHPHSIALLVCARCPMREKNGVDGEGKCREIGPMLSALVALHSAALSAVVLVLVCRLARCNHFVEAEARHGTQTETQEHEKAQPTPILSAWHLTANRLLSWQTVH